MNFFMMMLISPLKTFLYVIVNPMKVSILFNSFFLKIIFVSFPEASDFDLNALSLPDTSNDAELARTLQNGESNGSAFNYAFCYKCWDHMGFWRVRVPV